MRTFGRVSWKSVPPGERFHHCCHLDNSTPHSVRLVMPQPGWKDCFKPVLLLSRTADPLRRLPLLAAGSKPLEPGSVCHCRLAK